MFTYRCSLIIIRVLLCSGIALLISCSKQPLKVNIAADGQDFDWELRGKKFDPRKTEVSWKMQVEQWGDNGQPLLAQGKAAIRQPEHNYDAEAYFRFDATGLRHIKLTLSGATLPTPLTAEASRPGTELAAAGAAADPQAAAAEKLTPVSVEADASQWNDVAPHLSLHGTVAKGVDYSNWSKDSPAWQYDVEVRLKNKGTTPVIFDAAALSFVPGNGKPLSVVQTEQDPRRRSVTKSRQLKADSEEVFKTDSNGYTGRLLEQSGTTPLQFEVALWRGSQRVAGPFRAELPRLSHLPEVTSTPGHGVKGTAVYLTFKTVVPEPGH